MPFAAIFTFPVPTLALRARGLSLVLSHTGQFSDINS